MIRSDEFDDIYFSADNGLAETRYVFLENNNLSSGFAEKKRFTIAETGFGTGLNFLATCLLFERTAHPDAVLHFVSFEKSPLSPEDIRSGLKQWDEELNPYLDALIREYPPRIAGWHRLSFGNRINLTLIFDDVNAALPRMEIPCGVDAWFLDGFAPAKNPQMWTDTVFRNMARLSSPGTRFASFTSAGIVKRGLSAAGFHVEKRKGYGRKRDMIAGYYEGHNTVRTQQHIKNIAIIGGGLAGTACAYMLHKTGMNVTLFERSATLATGASGNPSGIFNPRLSAHRTPESDFYASGFSLAKRTFQKIDKIGYFPCGSLHLITDKEKEKKFLSCAETWKWNEDHMKILDSAEASEIAGIPLRNKALYIPDSGQVSPELLCPALSRNIEIRLSTPFKSHMTDRFDAVIFANGAEIRGIDALSWIPVHTVRGQIVIAKTSGLSSGLKTSLCFGGYIGAALHGQHVIGSTFQKWLTHTDILEEDTDDILLRLDTSVPGLGFVKENITGARAALRCSSQDRFPVIGKVPDSPNLYTSVGHGSHGTVSTLMGAQILADIMTGSPWSLPADSVNTLNPERFLIRQRRKNSSNSL